MKGLILAGGRGSRFREETKEKNKCMMSFLGRPLIENSLQNAKQAGLESIIIVVGYLAEDIINHYGTSYQGTPIQYVIQKEQKGLVDAMASARDFLAGSDFMLFLADEVLSNPKHSKMIEEFKTEKLFISCGIVHVEDLTQIRNTYAVFGDDETRQVYRLVEKPRTPLNSIMGTGNCIMSSKIFDYLDLCPINSFRGEKELPDLIQCAVDSARSVKYFDIGDGYINVNNPADIKAAEELFKKIETQYSP